MREREPCSRCSQIWSLSGVACIRAVLLTSCVTLGSHFTSLNPHLISKMEMLNLRL